MTVRKAVIPAAGLGTRFLPATKSVPKEMLPVVDVPAIQLVVEEAVRAGLTDVLMVSGRTKRALEEHFDRAIELEQTLEAKGDTAKLAAVRASSGAGRHPLRPPGRPEGARPRGPQGRRARRDEPFAVLLGDDLIDARDPLLEQMIAVQTERGGNVVALMEVPHEQISMYGCAAVSGDGRRRGHQRP